ncbi:hypothetical protein, partial [Burkholderia ubonensis]|uniref:hypothetical protein n=1 Tax=Burkholderia ubonensis TaxID=101571 RepID=UPI001E3E4452
RPLRDDEDLDTLLTWRETRRVTKSLSYKIFVDSPVIIGSARGVHSVWLSVGNADVDCFR